MSGRVCERVVRVVVTHDGPGRRLSACLDALGRHDVGPVIVVDNGEHDGVPDDAYGPHATVVVRVPNRGYGAAVNVGVERARAMHLEDHYVAVLNDDVVVAADWLTPLVAALDADEGLGAVQPKLMLAGSGLVNSVGVVFDRLGAASDLGYGEADDERWAEPIEIGAFTGGAVVLRPAFLADTSGFDERYFLYYEDVDLALRGAELGWRYRCIPSSRVVHDQGSSVSALDDEVHFLRERNRLWTTFRFHDARTVLRGVWLGVRRVRHAPTGAHARALTAGVAGAPRRLLERRRARSGR